MSTFRTLPPLDTYDTARYKIAATISLPEYPGSNDKVRGMGVEYMSGLVPLPTLIANKSLDEIKEQYTNTKDIVMFYFWLKQVPLQDKLKEITKFTSSQYDEDSMMSAFNGWLSEFENNKRRTMKIYDRIIGDQQNIADVFTSYISDPSYPEIKHVNITKSISGYVYNPKILDNAISRPADEDDGLVIFNNSFLSINAPYIQYVGDTPDKIWYKLYHGDTMTNNDTNKISYETIISRTSDISGKPNTIYILLWLGDILKSNALRGTEIKGSYYIIKYSLSDNVIDLDSKTSKEVDAVLKVLSNTLIGVSLGKEVKTRTNIKYDIPKVAVSDQIMAYVVMNSRGINNYFYMTEKLEPLNRKVKLKLHYLSIYPDVPTISTLKPNLADVSFTNSNNTLKITIDEFPTPEIGEYVMRLVDLVIMFNYVQENDIATSYEKIIGISEYKVGIVDKGPENSKQISMQNSRIRTLQANASDFIDTKFYAKNCQAKQQPLIMSHEQAKAFMAKKFRFKDIEYNNQVIVFPSKPVQGIDPNAIKYFGCDDPEYPFPGVKINKNVNGKYPWVPCCFKTDQSTSTNYNDFLQGNAPRKGGAKGGTSMITIKSLDDGIKGILPRLIDTVLVSMADQSGITSFQRLGVVMSPNSFLHCICMAMENLRPQLYDQKTQTYPYNSSALLKEKYVLELRNKIANTIDPNTYRQELYDYTPAQIKQMVMNPDTFFDPALYFRGVEEYFNINIYTFFSQSDRYPNGGIDIPRYKAFRAHPAPDRPTVLIFKNYGTSNVSVQWPRCELIQSATVNPIRIFDSTLGNSVHTFMFDSSIFMTWSTLDNVARNNLYSVYNFTRLFSNIPSDSKDPRGYGTKPIGQYIDSYGKCRALIYKAKPANEVKYLVMIIPPSQVNNLPVMDLNTLKPLITVSELMKYSTFKKPTHKIVDDRGVLGGLWYYAIDLTYCVAVMVDPVPEAIESINLPNGPPNPLLSTGSNITQRLSKLRKDLRIITQVLQALYRIEVSNNPNNKNNLRDFISKYFVIDTRPIKDSAKYYDLNNIPYELPATNNVDKAISWYQSKSPTLFNNGKVVMYNQAFYNGMVQVMTKYDDMVQLDLSRNGVGKYLKDYFLGSDDFKSQPNVDVFIGKDALVSWVSSMNSKRLHQVSPIITVTLAKSRDPFILRYSIDNNIVYYLIQNVAPGPESLQRALNVAMTWRASDGVIGANLGYNARPTDIAVPYYLYVVGNTNTPIPKENRTNGSERYVSILDYSVNNFYAAMLPLF